jgi:hypothetical protein
MQISVGRIMDRRLRLVSLAYEVLRDIKIPDVATDAEILALLSQAYLDRATVLAQPKASAPKGRGGKPSFLYSTPNIGTSALRRAH